MNMKVTDEDSQTITEHKDINTEAKEEVIYVPSVDGKDGGLEVRDFKNVSMTGEVSCFYFHTQEASASSRPANNH